MGNIRRSPLFGLASPRLGIGSCAVALVIIGILLARPLNADADIVRGLVRMVAGVLEIPRSTLAGTFSGPPIIGTVAGVLSGALNGIAMVAGGALETALSAIPFAAKLAPYIPIFL